MSCNLTKSAVRGSGTIRRMELLVAASVVGVLWFGTLEAGSGSTGVIRSYPEPHDIVDGSMVQVHLCFEAPVDHERSTLPLGSSEAIRQLRPRLEEATDCLFTIVGRLAPGDYELVWGARLLGGRVDNGTLPITVVSSQERAFFRWVRISS
jgi:hypothetical protein